MPGPNAAQTQFRIGVDVGGTFTDLVAVDGAGALSVVKIPSTPPDFHRAVIDAVGQAAGADAIARIVHGSTVATNALLQRTGQPIALITTEGFKDILLIGRQNRPSLYALNIDRPTPLAQGDAVFSVRERIGASGEIVEPLSEADVDSVVQKIVALGLSHVAVCLLFSFINPEHERLVGRRCEKAGLTVSLSSQILPEFREYERASTTAINAALRPVVATYLDALSVGLSATAPSKSRVDDLRIMHSSGGTLTPAEASQQAARLVLSGPAGGVMGAAFVAKQSGWGDVITYDMGGTSTDVAVILNGQPQWTTTSNVDGLPLGLPMFDIHTVGAGGGSIASIDAGGALRVGPRSAGARPGPACYGRGGTEPTVTDANLVLGRILPSQFLGGAMRVDRSLAERAIEPLARAMSKSVVETALGIVRVAEANMERAIRHVTSQRGHDPSGFALVSFGGAGGLHACALADALDIRTVLVPPFCGVLSALGMVVAPAVVDASRSVLHLGQGLDDHRLIAEIGSINAETIDAIPYEQTDRVEAYADVRFRGQSHELKVKLDSPTIDHLTARFHEAYSRMYGRIPSGREVEIVTLRIRRIGKIPPLQLPPHVHKKAEGDLTYDLVLEDGKISAGRAYSREALSEDLPVVGPFLLIDAQSTTFVPPGWLARIDAQGIVSLGREK